MSLPWQRGDQAPAPRGGAAPRAGGVGSSAGGNKADVLAALRRTALATAIPPFVSFTVATWRRRPASVVGRIVDRLQGTRVAVRSSARDESALPGHYRTVLDVPRAAPALRAAIARVAASLDGDPRDQIVVQEMVAPATMSGVVVTADLATGAAYDVIERDDSGRTDRVTGGAGGQVRTAVHRDAPRSALRGDPRLGRVRALARALERQWPGRPVEIELAETADGRLHVLQARPVDAPARTRREHAGLRSTLRALARAVAARAAPDPALAGSHTILGQMPDWNPAELIGPFPHPLALSLFRVLISDRTWRAARARLGYRRLHGVALVGTLAGRPYVDVRASFNSLLPAGLRRDVAAALVDAWLARLRGHPALHDRVELEVAETVRDLDFDGAHDRRYRGVLTARARADYAARLGAVTAHLLGGGPRSSLARALRAVEAAARVHTPPAAGEPGDAARALALLAACRRRDVLPYAIVARHAFAAEAMLRSAVRREALAPERVEAFKRSLATVAAALARDLGCLRRGTLDRAAFMRAYGHLRPGSFDVTSPRYDETSWEGSAAARHEAGEYAAGVSATGDTPAGRSVHLAASNEEPPGCATGSSGLERERRGCSAGVSALDDPPATPRAGSPDDEADPCGASTRAARFRPTARERRHLDALLREAGLPVDADGLLGHAATAIAGRERAKLLMTRRLSDALELLARWGARAGLARADVAFLTLADVAAAQRRPTRADGRALRETIARRRAERVADTPVRLGALVCDPGDVWVVRDPAPQPTFVTTRALRAPTARLGGGAGADVRGRIVCIESADPGFDWIFAGGLAGLVTRFGGANSHMAVRCTELRVPAALGVGGELFERVVGAGAAELRCGERALRPVWVGPA